VSETVDPGADPRLRFDDPMQCVCGGTGTVTDAADTRAGWWLVSWLTEHRPGCPGLTVPERAYLVDADAMAAGDVALPGLGAAPSGAARPGRPRPLPGDRGHHWPAVPQPCRAGRPMPGAPGAAVAVAAMTAARAPMSGAEAETAGRLATLARTLPAAELAALAQEEARDD
jgi:hypothetical protein